MHRRRLTAAERVGVVKSSIGQNASTTDTTNLQNVNVYITYPDIDSASHTVERAVIEPTHDTQPAHDDNDEPLDTLESNIILSSDKLIGVVSAITHVPRDDIEIIVDCDDTDSCICTVKRVNPIKDVITIRMHKGTDTADFDHAYNAEYNRLRDRYYVSTHRVIV